MLIDCFPYFNEKELLELRIRTLEDYVDGFLITDANRTHRGDEKPFTCVDTLKELGIDDSKVQVLHVELPSIEEAPDPWLRERAQRDALGVGLHMCSDETLFVCSDCDELVNPLKLDKLRTAAETSKQVVRASMSMHYGRADRQLITPDGVLHEWQRAFVSTVGFLKKHSTLSVMRESQDNMYLGERDFGWHLSWMGDGVRRKNKLRSIAEYYMWDTPDVQRRCELFEPQEGNLDMLGRDDHLITTYPLSALPSKLFELERVKTYLLPENVN